MSMLKIEENELQETIRIKRKGLELDLPRNAFLVDLRSFLEIGFANHIESVSTNLPREDFIVFTLIIPPDGCEAVIGAIVTKNDLWRTRVLNKIHQVIGVLDIFKYSFCSGVRLLLVAIPFRHPQETARRAPVKPCAYSAGDGVLHWASRRSRSHLER
jgi:hypothetical protein